MANRPLASGRITTSSGTARQATLQSGNILVIRRRVGKGACARTSRPSAQARANAACQTSPAARVPIASAIGAGIRCSPRRSRQRNPSGPSVTPTGPRDGAHDHRQSVPGADLPGGVPRVRAANRSRGVARRARSATGLGRTDVAVESRDRAAPHGASNAAVAPAGHRASAGEPWRSAISSRGSQEGSDSSWRRCRRKPDARPGDQTRIRRSSRGASRVPALRGDDRRFPAQGLGLGNRVP